MYSIVLIDDDSAYISIMEAILLPEGFDVRSASDGYSGLNLIRERRPDLILCDVIMPDMDGYSVLDAVNRETALTDIPFIFVTGLEGRTELRRGMLAGADDYLSKPFTADELLAAVTVRIRRHEMILAGQGRSHFQEEHAFLRQRITKREREVLLKVGQGATSKEIAERLGVALKTVEVHRANLMHKLNVGNAAALARWALIAEQMTDEID